MLQSAIISYYQCVRLVHMITVLLHQQQQQPARLRLCLPSGRATTPILAGLDCFRCERQ